MIFRKIKNSIKYAYFGLRFFLKERNIKIHLFFTFLVITLGFLFRVTSLEWIAIIFSITLVLSLEIINTVIEDLTDLVNPEISKKVMVIKDLAAAAVFVAVLGSIVIGLVIFLPYLIKFFLKGVR